MENTIEVKEAYYVSRENIVPVKAFSFKEAGSYGSTNSTYYDTDKGWKKASDYGTYREIAWSKEDATELKQQKIRDHIEYLRKQTEQNAAAIVEMEKELEK